MGKNAKKCQILSEMCEMERICTNFLFGYFELVYGTKLCAQCGISKIKKIILFDQPYCTVPNMLERFYFALNFLSDLAMERGLLTAPLSQPYYVTNGYLGQELLASGHERGSI